MTDDSISQSKQIEIRLGPPAYSRPISNYAFECIIKTRRRVINPLLRRAEAKAVRY